MNLPHLVVLSICLAACLPIHAQTRSKAPAAIMPESPPKATLLPLSSTDEAKDAIKTLRLIEATVSSGVNFRDYGKAVSDLTAVLRALDEVLVDRRAESIQLQVAEVLKPYQTAKELWSFCLTSRECGNGFINMKSDAISKVME